MKQQRFGSRVVLVALSAYLIVPGCDDGDTPGPTTDGTTLSDIGKRYDQLAPRDSTAPRDGARPVDGVPPRLDGAGACSTNLQGQPCSDGASCLWANDCDQGRCDCVNSSYVCVVTSTCQGSCPAPQEARCNRACEGAATGCLCNCGGPEFSGCSCVSGTWECVSC